MYLLWRKPVRRAARATARKGRALAILRDSICNDEYEAIERDSQA